MRAFNMMSTIRTSRRSALLLGVGLVLMVITLFAFKDLHEKLDVMTASNAGYQKMTDSQSDKIRSLVAEINDLKDLHKKNVKSMSETETELKSKLSKSENKVSDLAKVHQDLSKLRSEFETLSKNHLRTTEDLNRVEAENAELQKSSNAVQREKDSLAIELRDQIAQISLDRDTYKRQYTALFKQTQENEDTIGLLQKEKERLEIQIQDLTRQQELQQWQPQQQLSSKQQQQQQQQVSSQQLPIVQHPNGPTGMGFPSTSTKKDQLSPQVNLEDPQAGLLAKGPTGVSSTTQGVKSGVQEGVGIAQPPLAGVGPPPPHQPEFVQQVGKEDVMEAPGLNDQPIVRQLPPQQQPLRQPRQRPQLVPQQLVQSRQQPRELPYLQQQQQQLFHNNLLNQYQQQPILNPGYQQRNIAGGENLDQQVDHIQQDHPDLLGEPAAHGGHQGLDDYEGDDAADGQIENQNYLNNPRRKENDKINDVDYDQDQVHDNRYDTFAKQNFGQPHRKIPVKNPYLQNQPVVFPHNNNNNNNHPLRYLAQPPIQPRGRPYRDF